MRASCSRATSPVACPSTPPSSRASSAHTRQLIDLAEEKSRATVLARVVVKEPADDWKGFFIFEKRPKPHPFAFVVEHII